MNLTDFLTETRQRLETALQQTFKDSASESLTAAVHYSLLDGGKRLRPALVRAAAQLAGDNSERWLVPAQALEMIHVYSLVHDDLPAMDDDSLRRGRPTNHIQFNEATAILAGDALQTEAFRILSEAEQLSDAQARSMILQLAKQAGATGMVGGQLIDLESEHKTLTVSELENLHSLKTGALMNASLQMGALCSTDISPAIQTALQNYAHAIGLAFQITDDILDVTSSTEVLGKPQGSDEAAEKSTYVSLLGLEGAKEKANEQFERAITALETLKQNSDSLLWQLAEYVINRDH